MSGAPELRGGRRARALERAWDAPEVWSFAAVGSTNDVARALAERGAPGGTVVLAAEQLAGRGRGGRGWLSPAGLGAWLSLVLRPARLDAPALLPLTVALAAARAVGGWLPPPGAGLKWPNDLFFGGRKLGGVLCEATWEGARPAHVIVGVGVNVLHRPEHFPAELRSRAVSLRMASGAAPAPTAVAGAIAEQVRDAASPPPASLTGSLARELAERDVLAGSAVEVREEGRAGAVLRGVALGIAPDGALLLRTAAGVLRSVRGGSILRVGAPRAAALARPAHTAP